MGIAMHYLQPDKKLRWLFTRCSLNAGTVHEYQPRYLALDELTCCCVIPGMNTEYLIVFSVSDYVRIFVLNLIRDWYHRQS